MKTRKTKRVYLISRDNGTYQMGRTIYCLPTGVKFDTDSRKPRSYFIYIDIPASLRDWSAIEFAHKEICEIFGSHYR